MLKYRVTKSALLRLLVLCSLAGLFFVGVLPELEAIGKPRTPGEIHFTSPRPDPVAASSSAEPRRRPSGRVSDWFSGRFDELMTWEHNPWKIKKTTFGSHYFELLASKDPKDKAKAAELRQRAEALLQRVLERYPELAVTMKNVPAAQNGFLKWLELSERINADPSRPGTPGYRDIGLPKSWTEFINDKASWDAAAIRAWLAGEKDLLEEVRAIGSLPDQSVNGIDIDRYGFISARLGKSLTEMLLMDARLAAEEGDVDRALSSVKAATGLAAHFGNVETPSLLAVTVQILIQRQVEDFTVSHILPALPAGQLDARAWEEVVDARVRPPAEFARIMKGEWHITARQYLLPMLTDTEDPKYPVDPEALIDHFSGGFVQVIENYQSTSPADWTTVSPPGFPDNSHLSRESRELTDTLFVGTRAWSRGLERSQNGSGLTQAAFAILQGQPVQNDPIHNLPYRWNPATRELAAPDSPEFEGMDLPTITVPAP
ncbi:hypothetical protein [Luteolibacter marinus]|uniref:hypothetical protein n=1 Tax=Luteolibacter marinus TaxID=2776705 RepID=UPI0018661E81|nr:hypothetical protein [Luteolibacter marinus]